MPVIRISDELYSRLESYAVGFDTPSALIERLLDKIDGFTQKSIKISAKAPKLIFKPSDEDEFKETLLKRKQVEVTLHKANGTLENRVWKAERFSKNSNLRGNLWSGLLRGWKKKGIVKVELTIMNN